MNDIYELIKQRRSVKKYKKDMVPAELIEKIAEAGSYAPSGKNKQSPIILAITNKKVRDQLAKINAKAMGVEGIDPFYGAPVVLVVLAKKDVFTCVHDGSLVMANMMLMATDLGLGSCWIHRAKEEFETDEGKSILKKLGITEEYIGIGNLIVGYADEKPVLKPRKEHYVYHID